MDRVNSHDTPCAEQALSHESLWAVSDDGLLWQINPLTRQASPVFHLANMAAEPRQKLLQQVVHLWREQCSSDT